MSIILDRLRNINLKAEFNKGLIYYCGSKLDPFLSAIVKVDINKLEKMHVLPVHRPKGNVLIFVTL